MMTKRMLASPRRNRAKLIRWAVFLDVPIAVQAQVLRDDLTSRTKLHVWRVNLADQQSGNAAEAQDLLSPRERHRAAEFLRPEPRINYIKGRNTLRCLLGLYLHRHPADVRIETTKFGKPFIALPRDAWLCFNLAHSGARLLVAFGRGRRIGVDIERVREDVDHATLIQTYFAADERAALARLPAPDRLPAFFHCWTRKEAYLKATGQGLSTPLNAFVVSAIPRLPSALLKVDGDPDEAARWTLRDVPVAPGYAAAVAAEGEGLELRCLDATAALLADRSAFCSEPFITQKG